MWLLIETGYKNHALVHIRSCSGWIIESKLFPCELLYVRTNHVIHTSAPWWSYGYSLLSNIFLKTLSLSQVIHSVNFVQYLE